MESDWSAEVGEGLPEIHLPWSGFTDLAGLAPDAIAARVSEARDAPALARALSTLNASGSPVWTSKCDVWVLKQDEIDPYEFEASLEEARCGRASYIDVVARDPEVFRSFELVEAWARAVARTLLPVALSHARVEVVLRAASVQGAAGYALTLYAFGCGADPGPAEQAWARALEHAAAATIATIPESAAGE